ncbi:MAG: tRNA (guanosine(37)-N1)-methyltransferase TrmD [Candidatus Saccharibacteria bacterium]
MKKISIITLFTGMFGPVLNTSMLKKAQQEGLVEFNLVDLRDFGIGPRKTVDDTPYGGGAGMVLRCEPIFEAVESIKKEDPGALVIMMTPRGKKYSQLVASKLSSGKNIIILCGHYEGFDERILSIVDHEISMGDFILTGGEIPAMAIVDSVVRLIPGVLGDERSNKDESFSRGLLEYPHYTRPEEFEGMKVPGVLKSGNHAEIEKWRRSESVKKTEDSRPDLIGF